MKSKTAAPSPAYVQPLTQLIPEKQPHHVCQRWHKVGLGRSLALSNPHYPPPTKIKQRTGQTIIVQSTNP